MAEWIHPAEKLKGIVANDANKRRYRKKMELLGYSEDPFCHLKRKGAHSSGDLAGWDGFTQNCVCPGSPSSPAFIGQEVLSPRLAVCFVTLTRSPIVFQRRLHTYPGGLAKIQIVHRLRV